MNKRAVETAAGEALLDVGISIPLKSFRLPFRRKPVQLRVTLRRPYLGGQIRIARLYLQMGITYEKMKRFTREEQMAFLAAHGRTLSRMVALTLCRGKLTGLLLSKPVAWLLRWWVEDIYLEAACTRFISLLGTRSFGNFIASVERTNPLEPLAASQKGKRS